MTRRCTEDVAIASWLGGAMVVCLFGVDGGVKKGRGFLTRVG